MDTPINLLPKQARWSGVWAAWKVFAYQEEVAHPSLVLLRVRNSGLNGWDPDIAAVERGAYPYWTGEYLYTYSSPASGTLAATFLIYLNSDAAKDILRSHAYTPCVDRQQSLMATLCRG